MTERIQTCEICGEILNNEDDTELTLTCRCLLRQDATFYVNSDGPEYVWDAPLNTEEGEIYGFSVIRNGEMRIKATDAEGNDYTLRYTSDIEDFGITTDEQLYEAGKDEENFYWDNNAWFEIVGTDDDNSDYYSDAYDTLDNAIAEAIRLRKEGN